MAHTMLVAVSGGPHRGIPTKWAPRCTPAWVWGSTTWASCTLGPDPGLRSVWNYCVLLSGGRHVPAGHPGPRRGADGRACLFYLVCGRGLSRLCVPVPGFWPVQSTQQKPPGRPPRRRACKTVLRGAARALP